MISQVVSLPPNTSKIKLVFLYMISKVNFPPQIPVHTHLIKWLNLIWLTCWFPAPLPQETAGKCCGHWGPANAKNRIEKTILGGYFAHVSWTVWKAHDSVVIGDIEVHRILNTGYEHWFRTQNMQRCKRDHIFNGKFILFLQLPSSNAYCNPALHEAILSIQWAHNSQNDRLKS